MTAEEIIAECDRLCARPGIGIEGRWHQGRPPGAKPTLPEVRRLTAAYYKLPDNAAGGELHCVLDDRNYERGFIWSSLHAAEQHVSRALCWVLLLLSNSQRRRGA